MINKKRWLFIRVTLIFLAGICSVLFYKIIVDTENIPFNEQKFDIPKKTKKKIIITFRNDDLSAESDPQHEYKVLKIFLKYNIKQTFAYIPKRGDIDSNTLRYLREYQIVELLKKWEKEGKIDLALHGYDHKKNEYSAGEFKGLPFEMQLSKIQKGKEVIKRNLENDVNIFVPPWNQADENTIRACIDSGINIFSGYLGENTAKGITLVNSNAVFFKSKKKDISKGYGLQALEKVFKYSKTSDSVSLIIVVYHSRVDLRKQKDYEYLENFLNMLNDDPEVEFLSIGEIAKDYKNYLDAYNHTGLLLKQINYAIHIAKPYLLIIEKGLKIFGAQSAIRKKEEQAFEEYYRGNYQKVNNIARETISKCIYIVKFGRLSVFLLYVSYSILILFLLRQCKVQKKILYFFILIYFPLISTFIILNILKPFSSVRLLEFNNIFILCICCVISLSIYILSENKSEKKNKNFFT